MLYENFDEFESQIQETEYWKCLVRIGKASKEDIFSGRHKKSFIQLTKDFCYGCQVTINLSIAFKVVLFLLRQITGNTYDNSYEYEFSNFTSLRKKMELDDSLQSLLRSIDELKEKNIICVFKENGKFKIRLNFFVELWNIPPELKNRLINKMVRRI